MFYVTKPVGGVVGFGKIQTKFKQNTPLWPAEIATQKVIWPLRFEFDVVYCLPQDDWSESRATSRELFPRAGFKQVDQKTAQDLSSALLKIQHGELEKEVVGVAESPAAYTATPKAEKDDEITHNQVKQALFEIGSLQKFVCQEEYPFEMGKLDVVWRRIEKSVPTYVFEVQVGGDIYHALAKLKHAYDLWNSHIFLIASKEDNVKASMLLSGTFHEISKRVRLIELGNAVELLKRKKSYFEYEKALGIY